MGDLEGGDLDLAGDLDTGDDWTDDSDDGDGDLILLCVEQWRGCLISSSVRVLSLSKTSSKLGLSCSKGSGTSIVNPRLEYIFSIFLEISSNLAMTPGCK